MSVAAPRHRGPAAVGEAAPLRLAAPSLKGVVRILAIVVACAIVLYLTWQIRGVVRLVVIALFVALTLMPVVVAARTRISRAPIILVVFLILAMGVVVVGAVVVPSMVAQVRQISHDAPRYATELRRNATARGYDDRYHITARVERDARALPSRLGSATGALQAVTVKVFGAVGQLVTVLIERDGRTYWSSPPRRTGSPHVEIREEREMKRVITGLLTLGFLRRRKSRR